MISTDEPARKRGIEGVPPNTAKPVSCARQGHHVLAFALPKE
ncbi:hypothetical protein [Pseudomonas solani]